ncbi:hypothetical protein [Lactococcus lactis]|uniref:Uncharacterized protein n=1 Tax=Lactococcus lactis TaxID=1358 RepID=A0AAW5TN74_9LACT|nr:hypothetical protein [Lactococcus lactis]MCW2280168.1 hypothetical protein [Lactococcus lactis]
MKQKKKFIVMFFPTSSGEELVWLKVDVNQTDYNQSLLENPDSWQSNIIHATLFTSFYEAKKFARIAQELWHFSYFKVLEVNGWEIHRIQSLY